MTTHPRDDILSQTESTPTLEELAEDMLELMKQVNGIHRQQEQTSRRLEELVGALGAATKAHGRELGQLRLELLGERKALAATTAFWAIVDPLDQLRQMRSTLSPEKDSRTHAQVNGIVEVLSRTLRSLGFIEFAAREMEPFNPETMESVGFAEGEPGVVLKSVRPGYQAGESVVRPAGVLIANPAESS